MKPVLARMSAMICLTGILGMEILLRADLDSEALARRFAVRISEMMYQPPEGDAYEFLELQNTAQQTVDLSAFKIAGVKNILMSLWKVDDEATSVLMTRFYDNYLIKKLSIHDALNRTQKWMKSQKKYENPYYWGGFVLVE